MASALRRINSIGVLVKHLEIYSNVTSSTNIVLPRLLHLTTVQNGLRSKWRSPMLREMKKRVDILKEEGKYPDPIRSEFLDWNLDAELYAFGKRLNEELDEDLLREALTDPSYVDNESERLKSIGANDAKLDIHDNKELSIAGKKLIEDYCLKYLRAACPLLPEEAVRSFTDYLCSDEILAQVAQEMGFRDLIMTKGHPPSERTYAHCMAAVVSCLNVSSGLERCHKFILDFVLTRLVGKDLWDIWQLEDPLRLLEDILLRSGRGKPEPRLIGDLGKNTIESVYHVGIYDVDKHMIGEGYGESVNMAILVAAMNTLSELFNYSVSREPISFQSEDWKLLSKPEKNASIEEWRIS